jgi:hypothetical protein
MCVVLVGSSDFRRILVPSSSWSDETLKIKTPMILRNVMNQLKTTQRHILEDLNPHVFPRKI